MNSKNCTICNELKELSEFYLEKRSSDGRTARCKKCSNKKSAEYRANNKEKYLEATKLWKQRNKKRASELNKKSYLKHIAKRKQNEKTWRLNNKDKTRLYTMRRIVKKKQALMSWADKSKIERYYKIASFLSCLLPDESYEVDHIIPLQGANVCGLHCEDNLQVITRSENRKKGNKFNIEQGKLR